MTKLPVSVVICAINESKRIKDAILSAKRNNPEEVIVVEGGSSDNTVEISKMYTDQVFSVENFGLGFKRNFGINKSSQPYTLFLDADCLLPDGSLDIMLKELLAKKYVGIQPHVKGIKNVTYCQKGMENVDSFEQKRKLKPIKTMVIGTPSLWDKNILKKVNYDPNIGACDDTDICYRLGKKGYSFGLSTAVCFTKHRKTWLEVYKKFSWYGEGDCEFAMKHPERFFSIFTHPIRNFVIKRSLNALLDFKRIPYIPFFVFVGIVRHLSFYRFFIRSIFYKKIDMRQLNREDLDY